MKNTVKKYRITNFLDKRTIKKLYNLKLDLEMKNIFKAKNKRLRTTV
jgi:hypothetical protein